MPNEIDRALEKLFDPPQQDDRTDMEEFLRDPTLPKFADFRKLYSEAGRRRIRARLGLPEEPPQDSSPSN